MNGLCAKRAYWTQHNENNPDQTVLFLESSVADLRNGREAFESKLHDILTEAGVTVERLPQDELNDKVVTRHIARFSSMCLQYIQKAKKRRLSPEDMAKVIASATNLDLKTNSFLSIANNIYRRYQNGLIAKGLTDFDDLIGSAIELIHETNASCKIRIQDDRYVPLNELRWIIIDEYQDFSQLFFDLVSAIKFYNPSVRLFCVGDDWQAINSFAGSDLRYFVDFESGTPGGCIGELRNNYRSSAIIVNTGNIFMDGKGHGSVSLPCKPTGQVETIHTDTVFIEQRKGDQFSEDRKKDEQFQTWITRHGERWPADQGLRIGRILKACNKILSDPKYDSKTTFVILRRVERLGTGYDNMQVFGSKLKNSLDVENEESRFQHFAKRVHCGTVHSYKGLEADVVIVLGVNEGNFPKIHPDNELYSVFGVTATDVLSEEERLFYVAITRAKQDLYC